MRPSLLLLLLISVVHGIAQTASVNREIWFNEQYFITNANCEFADIQRITKFNEAGQVFDGDFTDYDKNGKTLLTGSYRDGKKEGTFKGYFSNSYLKWEGQYKNGEPVGAWFFYYSDGRPLSIIQIDSTGVRIIDHWDVNDKQAVSQGEGKYAIAIQPFGYNDRAFISKEYSGKVKNGLPDGQWKVDEIYSKSRHTIRTETFASGKFLYARDNYGRLPDRNSQMLFTPSMYFTNAEKLAGKRCLVDEQLNFITFFQETLTAWMHTAKTPLVPGKYEYMLDVLPNGAPRNLRMKERMKAGSEKDISGMIRTINYWIPSQKEGKPVFDTLTITIDVKPDGNDGNVRFGTPGIVRKNGS